MYLSIYKKPEKKVYFKERRNIIKKKINDEKILYIQRQ